MNITTQWVSSLTKIFPDETPDLTPCQNGSALRGELFHIQLAFCLSDGLRDKLKIELDSPLKPHIQAYEVRNVPVLLTSYPWSDDYYLRKTPGLYPDLLLPSDGFVTTVARQWRSIWFEVEIPEDYAAGSYPITVTLTHCDDATCSASATFELTVIPAVLPEPTLKYTEWFHTDCIADYYGIEIFSDRYWEYVAAYMKQAARYGVTMILTPIFTPPLDTEIGGERPTVQLIDVVKKNGEYQFGFDRLKRYIGIAQNAGIYYYEFAHLFTQWGAKCAVKVMATVDGVYQRIFGWETDATDKEYTKFLNAMLTALKQWLRSAGLTDRCFFHISDEPSLEREASYRAARNSVAEVLSDCTVIDALSDYHFYENGLVRVPIPSNSVTDEFLKKGVEHRWTYYCCGDVNRVSNRMLAMPSERNRILGMQLFKFQMEGFLHWGYNFWYNRLSQKIVNPFLCTDTEDTFPSGDAFLVYPGENGQPLPSIHQHVFADGLQDLRALQLLCSLTSLEETIRFLEEQLGMPITFSDYPHNAEILLKARNEINKKIASKIKM